MDSPLNTLPLLDNATLQQLEADTSAEATVAIVSATISDLRKLSLYMESDLATLEVADLKAHAHLCKSAAGYCGAAQLVQLCRELESACMDNNEAQLITLTNHGRDTVPATEAILQEWLDQR